MTSFYSFSFPRHLAFILFLSGLILLPGVFVSHPVDRDEPRYAQASKQMIESGDLIDIRFQDEPRYKKPIGVYWLQAGTVWLGEKIGLSDARMIIGVYRLPSFFAAVGVVFLTFWFGTALLGQLPGFLAALFLLGMGIFSMEARLATTDMLLTLATLMALIPLGKIYVNPFIAVRFWDFLLFWGGIAFGVLIKGPLILLSVGLCVLTLVCNERSLLFLRRLQPLKGLFFLIACVAPWFIAIGVRSGGLFFTHSLGTDMGQKILHGMESHGGPPGTYLMLAPFILGPCWAFFIFSIKTIIQDRHGRSVTFLLAWLIPSWLVFEAIPTKLPHYILPLTPPLALLVAWAMFQPTISSQTWSRFKKFLIVLLLGVIPSFIVIGLLVGTSIFGGHVSWIAGTLLSVTILLMGIAISQVWQGKVFHGSWSSVAAAGLLSLSFFGLIQPTWTSFHLSHNIVKRIEDMRHHAPLNVCSSITRAVVGYGEPSLVFLAGKDLVLTMPEGAADMISRMPCTIVMVESQKIHEFQQALLERNIVKKPQDEPVRGYNLGKGRFVELYFFI